MKKQYMVPVTWTLTYEVEVYAETPADAVKEVEKGFNDAPDDFDPIGEHVSYGMVRRVK